MIPSDRRRVPGFPEPEHYRLLPPRDSAADAEPLPPLPARAAVVSRLLPPGPEGQHIVLQRMLSGFDPDSYCLLSTERMGVAEASHIGAGPLPASYFLLKHGYEVRIPPRRQPLGPIERLRALARVAALAIQIARVCRRERSRVVVGCTASFYELPAAALAARLTRLPFVAYLFDDWAGQWLHESWRDWARWLEPWVARSAERLLATCEVLSECYVERHGRSATIVRDPTTPIFTAERREKPWPAVPGPPRIVFTGTLYEAHHDAFRRLFEATAALAAHGGPRFEIHVHTWQPAEAIGRALDLARLHLHPFAAPEDLVGIQRAADVLFLPLAFASPFGREHLLAAAPTKLAEYLASGRPILAHVPPGSFPSRFFAERRCGWLVDRPDAAELARALGDIAVDPVERGRAAQASRRAAGEFELGFCRGRFAEALAAAAAVGST